MPSLNPEALKIGYVILIAGRNKAVQIFQHKAGYGDSSKWTHVAGSIGGFDAVEARVPQSRVFNLQREYVDKGFEIKIMKRRNQEAAKRYKVALWWATMNNLPYDALQFFWFPLTLIYAKIGLLLHTLFSSKKRFLCSELITAGFYKEGDCLFNKPQESILPADFDNPVLFEEVTDIWLSAPCSASRPACCKAG